MSQFIQKDYQKIPFHFWLAKSKNKMLSSKHQFEKYHEYNYFFDKIKKINENLKKENDNENNIDNFPIFLFLLFIYLYADSYLPIFQTNYMERMM